VVITLSFLNGVPFALLLLLFTYFFILYLLDVSVILQFALVFVFPVDVFMFNLLTLFKLTDYFSSNLLLDRS